MLTCEVFLGPLKYTCVSFQPDWTDKNVSINFFNICFLEMSSYKDEDPIDDFIDVNRTTFTGGNSNAGNETIGYQCYDNGTLVVPVQVSISPTSSYGGSSGKLDNFHIQIHFF